MCKNGNEMDEDGSCLVEGKQCGKRRAPVDGKCKKCKNLMTGCKFCTTDT